MRVFDLSHRLARDMPAYPGTEAPRIDEACTIEKDGFAEKLLSMYSHTGTHLDAPSHMIRGGASIDGRGALVDLSASGKPLIEAEDLGADLVRFGGLDFILFRTGWDRFWGEEAYFSGFPVLAPGLAARLAALGLKGIGFDAISADPVGSLDFPNHHAILGAGMVIVENLAGLDALVDEEFTFACAPLRIGDGDGSPLRAFAFAP
jgi:arylformamidase